MINLCIVICTLAEPLEVDPIISKLIQLIDDKDHAIREFKGIIDGNCTCIQFIIEQINGQIIETQMTIGSNDLNSFEATVDKIANIIDMLETTIMHVLSNR